MERESKPDSEGGEGRRGFFSFGTVKGQHVISKSHPPAHPHPHKNDPGRKKKNKQRIGFVKGVIFYFIFFF